MEDVIFGGTEKRAPVGFAQVTLVLDNTGHLFPSMDESEVAVTRRYYRSGESEYYINRQSVRLKDMTELFMDTGMGREGYFQVPPPEGRSGAEAGTHRGKSGADQR